MSLLPSESLPASRGCTDKEVWESHSLSVLFAGGVKKLEIARCLFIAVATWPPDYGSPSWPCLVPSSVSQTGNETWRKLSWGHQEGISRLWGHGTPVPPRFRRLCCPTQIQILGGNEESVFPCSVLSECYLQLYLPGHIAWVYALVWLHQVQIMNPQSNSSSSQRSTYPTAPA